MSLGPWYVWTGGRAGGAFPTLPAALAYCYTLTNDHRRRREWLQLGPSCVRYIGPRGRRHGTRFVAWIGTQVALEERGVNVRAIMDQAEAS